ncbi:hypothetical protein GDO78_016647, partial [Eleutherodactylus coqui]
ECGLDVVFVIDGSGSVGAVNFRKMLEFVKKLISSLSTTDTQIALLQYSEKIDIEFRFRRFHTPSDLLDVTNIRYQDGTATRTATAMQSAVENLFIPLSRKNSRKLLIVITDGLSNSDAISFSEVTSKANELGIQRISIGVNVHAIIRILCISCDI